MSNFAVGYVRTHFLTHSQTPELFNSVSAYTAMSPIRTTFLFWSLTPAVLGYLASPRFWPLTKIWHSWTTIRTQKLPDFTFQLGASPDLALRTSLGHREMCKVLGSFSGSPTLSIQPQLWIAGSGCGWRLLCEFSAALVRSPSFHRCHPSGTSPAVTLMSHVEAN